MADTRAEFEKSFRFRVEPFETSRGVTLYAREFSAEDREWWEAEVVRRFPDDSKESATLWQGLRAGLLVRVLCNAEGKLLYPVRPNEDRAAILNARMDSTYLTEVYDLARAALGMDATPEKKS